MSTTRRPCAKGYNDRYTSSMGDGAPRKPHHEHHHANHGTQIFFKDWGQASWG